MKGKFVPCRHEETNLNGMQKARTWCSIQMPNIFIVFCNLELLTSVPQPITVPVMQSNCRAHDGESRYFPNPLPKSQSYPILAQLIT